MNCNKLLIRIGSQWFQLHVDDELDDHKDGLELDSIALINVEKLDVELEFNDTNDHDIIFDDKVDDALVHDSDTMAEADEKVEVVKRKKRKKSAVKTEPQKPNHQKKSKPEESKPETKTTQPRRKGPLPRIKCRICERIILKYNFDMHLLKMHVPNVIVSKEPVKCETCGKSLSSAGSLKIHRAIHTGTKRFGANKCPFYCDFQFINSRFSFTVCSYCGTSFRQLFHLTEHINGHTGNTPYKCKVCHKQFTRHQILKAHQRVHTGEKPHICGIEGCDRAYAYEIDLKRHKFRYDILCKHTYIVTHSFSINHMICSFVFVQCAWNLFEETHLFNLRQSFSGEKTVTETFGIAFGWKYTSTL